ncbi:MAG TPA: metallophosphoesterase [Gammaproteobacteria bacterium]|nr:metallophosphoesterase [Gammaproteobacteria bacterium]
MPTHAINLIHITDTHFFEKKTGKLAELNTYDSFQAVKQTLVQNLQKKAPDLIILTGDLSQDTSIQSYKLVAKELELFSCPIGWVPGNHDNEDNLNKVFFKTSLSRDKTFILGNWLIILLNSHWANHVEGSIQANELTRLYDLLKLYPQHHTLISLHHHILPIQTPWLDCINLVNHDAFLKIIQEHPQVQIVLSGHVHLASHQVWEGIDFYTTPSTCVQSKPKSLTFTFEDVPPGYRQFTLYPDGQYKTVVIRAKNYTLKPDLLCTGY